MRYALSMLLVFCLCFAAHAQTVPGTVNYPASQDTAVSLFETADNAASVLALSISSGATTANVTSTARFAATGSLVIDSEVIYYTGKTSTTLTGLLRGRSGTTAAAHASGAQVRAPVLAAHHNSLAAAIIALEQKLGFTVSAPSSGKFLRGTGSGASEWDAITDSDLPATFTGKALSGGTATGLTCVGCTNIGTGSAGGTANTGDTVNAADTDANGAGRLIFQTGGVERTSIEANGAVKGFTGRTVYASAAKVVLDSNLTSGGGTDATAALQAQLDLAQTAPLHLVIDGPARAGQLTVYSNTTIECIDGGGLYQKNGANKSLLVNANPSASTVIDHDITITGCTLNGNYANQTGVGLFGTQEANGNLIGLLQMFGVNNLRLEHLRLVGSKTITAHVGNLTNLYVNDIYMDNNIPGQVQGGGLQLEGPVSYFNITNVRGTTEDDLLALNTDDCVWVNGAFTGLGPYVSCGAITDGTVDGIVGFDAGYGVRTFNATNRLDRVRISNISGSFLMRVFHNDPLTIGPGNIGTLVIDGVNVAPGVAPHANPAIIDIYGRAERLVFRDIKVGGLIDTRPIIKVNTDAQVDTLEVSGLGIDERTSASAGFIPVDIAGSVGRLTGSNWSWRRDMFLAHASDFIKLTATNSQVEELALNGVFTNRVNRIAYQSTGRLLIANLTNVRQADCLGGVTVQAAGAIGVVNISNWLADYGVPTSGSIGRKMGDAFPADTTAPTFSSASATGGSPFVVVTFPEPVNSSNFANGVTIKKNTVTQTISSAKRREYDSNSVEFVLSANISGGDTVTWEYAAGSGNYADLQNNPLANVSAQAVTVSRTGYVYDLFTAADGTAMNGRTPSPLTTSANTYATLIGTAGNQTVRGGRLHLDATSGTQSIVVDSTAANVIAYGTLTATRLPSNAGLGIIFRASDASNYWLVWVTNDATRLIKVVAGVTAVVQTVSAAHFPGVPYVVSVTANGSAISATVSGGETVSTTDAFNSTATKHGVHAAGAVMAADDFTVVSAP